MPPFTNTRSRVLSALIPLLSYSATQADDFADMSLQDLMSVDVFTSATLMPTPISKAPGTVFSFTRDDFERYGVRRVDDLLQFVPGMQVNQYRKRHRSHWARGLLDRYNDKMILLVDGIRRQHLYYGHYSLGDNFPLERVEKVEVILGPASSLYGANAFAGIISVTTRDFSQQPRLEVNLEVGDNARTKSTGLYNSDKVQVFASYLDQEAPYRDQRLSFIGSEVLQPLDEEHQLLQVKARPIDGLTLTLEYSESETPFLFIPATQDAFIEEENLFFSADYEWGSLESGKLDLNLFYHRDDTREYELEQTTRRLGYEEFQNATLGGISATVFKTLANHTLATGVSWRYEEAEEMTFERWFHFRDGFLDPSRSGELLSAPGVTNDDFGWFVQDVWDLNEQLQLTLSGRYDSFDQFDDYFNYRAAAVYTHNYRHVWKLMHGTAIRTPGIREYLKVLEDTDFVPPNPDAEGIQSTELAYVYSGTKHSISVTAYDNSIDEFVVETPTPDGADEYFANSNSTLEVRGVELLLDLNPTSDLNMRLSVSQLDPELELPYVASWTSSLNLNYQWQAKHRLGISAVHNSDRSDPNSYTSDNPGDFVIVNLSASGELSPSLRYSLGIDNLFDREVHDPAGDFADRYNTEKSEREVWLRLTWTPTN